MANPLTDAQRAVALAELTPTGWALDEGGKAITKTFKFTNFPAAIAWMVQMMPTCETLNHHPEWKNVYNRVEVLLTTHDLDALSDLDLALAKAMDAAVQ
ncbi:MAG: 4a-hydroxytetrahydrobiopterin dehydratase [Pseudomonadota bacterium]